MKVKLFAFDLDGTTLDNNGAVSPENLEAIRQAAKMGIEPVPCTGRSYREVPEELLNLPEINHIITSNGAARHKNGENVSRYLLKPDELAVIAHKTGVVQAMPEFYVEGVPHCVYTPELLEDIFQKFKIGRQFFEHFTSTRVLIEDINVFVAENGHNVEKVHAFLAHETDFDTLVSHLQDIREGLEITSSHTNNIEITKAGVSKGQALQELCEELDIPLQSMAVIGDSKNDLSMLQCAGYGFVPENAAKDIQQKATQVVRPNTQSALAHALTFIEKM